MPTLGEQLSVSLDEMRQKARRNVDQTWTTGDAEVIEFPTDNEEKGELAAETDGGRYWDRTSDLCRVKAALSR